MKRVFRSTFYFILYIILYIYIPYLYNYLAVNSTSSVATKYDPDLVRSDVALARDRVARLRNELTQIEGEVRYKERGVDTLVRVDQKMGDNHYTVGEAQDILNRIRFIRKSMRVGEREKKDLMAVSLDFLLNTFHN